MNLCLAGMEATYSPIAVTYNDGTHWWADIASSAHFKKRRGDPMGEASYRYDGMEADGRLRFTSWSHDGIQMTSDSRRISFVLYRRRLPINRSVCHPLRKGADVHCASSRPRQRATDTVAVRKATRGQIEKAQRTARNHNGLQLMPQRDTTTQLPYLCSEHSNDGARASCMLPPHFSLPAIYRNLSAGRAVHSNVDSLQNDASSTVPTEEVPSADSWPSAWD